MRHPNPAPSGLWRGIIAGLAIQGIAFGALAAVWVLIGSHPLLLRATFCPQQPLHQSCTITFHQ
jgi:sorbitol-specific phosphotransferase system component IIC